MQEYDALVVLRHGETFLKGANRRFFEDLLFRNTQRALRGVAGTQLSRAQGRFFVHCTGESQREVTRRVAAVFGYSSISPAQATPQDLEVIANTAVTMMAALLERRDVASFKVETQRSDKGFPFMSPQVSRDVGAAIFTTHHIPVDLHQPAVTVGVEIGERQSFVFAERLPGAGGLPVGASGKVMLLLSGGIDSPVAGHLLQKRGAELEGIYFHAPPHTSEHAKDKVIQLAERLATRQHALSLYVVNFTALQERLRNDGPADLAVVLYRRAMMRIASRVARTRRCKALVTGENLGQVASQTLENLACIEEAAELPILRPLIGYDKTEIISLARVIDTYETSILPHEDTCSLFVPKHPATRAKLQAVKDAEERIQFAELVAAAVETAERVDL